MGRKIGLMLWGVLLVAGEAWGGAGTLATTQSRLSRNLGADASGQITKVSVTYTAHSTAENPDALTLSSAGIPDLSGACLYQMVVNPGSTGPTGGAWDVTLADASGADITGGVLLDMSSSVTGQYVPLVGGAYGCRQYDGTALTLTVTGNAVNSASAVIDFYFMRP